MRRREGLNHLRTWLEANAPEIADLLGLPVRDWTLEWMRRDQSLGGAVALTHAAAGEIYVSWPWIRDHPDDFGCLAHEYTHLVQNVPGGTCPGDLVEGMADAVRYKLGLYDPTWWTPSAWASRIAMLSDDRFKELARSMAEGTYEPAWWA